MHQCVSKRWVAESIKLLLTRHVNLQGTLHNTGYSSKYAISLHSSMVETWCSNHFYMNTALAAGTDHSHTVQTYMCTQHMYCKGNTRLPKAHKQINCYGTVYKVHTGKSHIYLKSQIKGQQKGRSSLPIHRLIYVHTQSLWNTRNTVISTLYTQVSYKWHLRGHPVRSPFVC